MNKNDLINKIDNDVLMTRSLPDWRPILSEECQVFVFNNNYVARRFDQINYQFCTKDEAKEILVDNLYALLRYKYFTILTEEVDERITRIISSFIANLKTSLKKVSFDKDDEVSVNIKFLPDYCIAFKNGVYDFKNDRWFFKYDIIKLERLNNIIYLYDTQWIIMWYFNYNFEPLPISIEDTSFEEFMETIKELTKTNKNYCFELLYNMSHNKDDKFEIKRFKHLCQILGYTCLQSFSQHFVLMIGNGQNGKNSLFDGCFTHKILPLPVANSLKDIETNSFISGSLENKSHNLFLETNDETMQQSTILKSLTGSMYQTIERKGVDRYSTIINCKFIFAGNDKDKIKFSDTSVGFRRRVNLLNIYYQWDKRGEYLKNGDYYDTKFSEDLREIKNDLINTTTFIYFAMYGIKLGTDNFNNTFDFTENEWDSRFEDIDLDLKNKISTFTIFDFKEYIQNHIKMIKAEIFDEDKNNLKTSNSLLKYGDKINMFNNLFNDDDNLFDYFSNNDFYVNVRFLQTMLRINESPTSFTQKIKKIYKIKDLEYLYGNKPYVKCRFEKNRLKLIS